MDVTPVIHNTFVIERSYPVAPQKVFAAFSDPAKKRRWMGGDADGFEIVSFEMDFRVEAFERWSFRFQGGDLIKSDFCYKDIVPNTRIVAVYTMEFGDKRVSSSQVTVEFLSAGQGTTLRHTEQGAFFDGTDQSAGREHGTRGLLEELAKEIERAN